jgi:hypothetical protein
MREKAELYLCFLDVEKAYDKAWSASILHTMWNQGIRGKIWRIIRNLMSDLTASVQTKFGLTRIIQMNNTLKQGGVLSSTEFSKMMDELATELASAELGIMYGSMDISCLLLMDDIVIMAHTQDELKRMLEIVESFRKRYRVKFGQKKSKVIVINAINRGTNFSISLGEVIIESTKEYTYLGQVISHKGNMESHINHLKSKAEGCIQGMLTLGKESVLNKVKMQSLLCLYKSCIVPAMIHGCESWLDLYRWENTLEVIQNKCLKRILKSAEGTPTWAIRAELGILPIICNVEKSQLMYLQKILKWPDTRLVKQVIKAHEEYYGYNHTSWFQPGVEYSSEIQN